jgi:hypothetical protein
VESYERVHTNETPFRFAFVEEGGIHKSTLSLAEEHFLSLFSLEEFVFFDFFGFCVCANL